MKLTNISYLLQIGKEMNKFSKQSFLDYSVVWFVLRTYEVNKLLMNILELKQTKWYEKSNKNIM